MRIIDAFNARLHFFIRIRDQDDRSKTKEFPRLTINDLDCLNFSQHHGYCFIVTNTWTEIYIGVRNDIFH